jgi:hypothetical protein
MVVFGQQWVRLIRKAFALPWETWHAVRLIATSVRLPIPWHYPQLRAGLQPSDSQDMVVTLAQAAALYRELWEEAEIVDLGLDHVYDRQGFDGVDQELLGCGSVMHLLERLDSSYVLVGNAELVRTVLLGDAARAQRQSQAQDADTTIALTCDADEAYHELPWPPRRVPSVRCVECDVFLRTAHARQCGACGLNPLCRRCIVIHFCGGRFDDDEADL